MSAEVARDESSKPDGDLSRAGPALCREDVEAGIDVVGDFTDVHLRYRRRRVDTVESSESKRNQPPRVAGHEPVRVGNESLSPELSSLGDQGLGYHK